ncbi:MAG: tetratricopeptide repeat protein [Myxococcales bacterium]|nr:tetratricopeptide repeat protein [Myxococcales bacterium]
MHLTLRRRISLLKGAIVAGLIASAVVLADRFGFSVFWAAPVVVGLAWYLNRRVATWVAIRAHHRFTALVEQKRTAEAHELMHELRELYAGSVAALEQLRMNESLVYSTSGHHAQAIALLESIDPERLSAPWRPWYLNNLAWSLAHAGQAARAVAMARESIAASDAAGDATVMREDLRAFQLGTLGASLVLAGDAEDAVAPLEQSVARGGKPRHQAARAFYLGEALRALGRGDEARAAYDRAIGEAPDSEHGVKAKAALERLAIYR